MTFWKENLRGKTGEQILERTTFWEIKMEMKSFEEKILGIFLRCCWWGGRAGACCGENRGMENVGSKYLRKIIGRKTFEKQ